MIAWFQGRNIKLEESGGTMLLNSWEPGSWVGKQSHRRRGEGLDKIPGPCLRTRPNIPGDVPHQSGQSKANHVDTIKLNCHILSLVNLKPKYLSLTHTYFPGKLSNKLAILPILTINRNALPPSPKFHQFQHFSKVEIKVSSETQEKLLAVNLCKTKKQVT